MGQRGNIYNHMENQSLTLNECGFLLTKFDLDQKIKDYAANNQFQKIDDYFKKLTNTGGALFNYLKRFENFSSIEFIISLREAHNEWEEDGIWHDDGSRLLAFSLSIYDSHETNGGVLEIRKKKDTHSQKIPPFNFGEIVIFKTGTSGFEHKINAVTKGKRLIIAGWCS